MSDRVALTIDGHIAGVVCVADPIAVSHLSVTIASNSPFRIAIR